MLTTKKIRQNLVSHKHSGFVSSVCFIDLNNFQGILLQKTKDTLSFEDDKNLYFSRLKHAQHPAFNTVL